MKTIPERWRGWGEIENIILKRHVITLFSRQEEVSSCSEVRDSWPIITDNYSIWKIPSFDECYACWFATERPSLETVTCVTTILLFHQQHFPEKLLFSWGHLSRERGYSAWKPFCLWKSQLLPSAQEKCLDNYVLKRCFCQVCNKYRSRPSATTLLCDSAH